MEQSNKPLDILRDRADQALSDGQHVRIRLGATQRKQARRLLAELVAQMLVRDTEADMLVVIENSNTAKELLSEMLRCGIDRREAVAWESFEERRVRVRVLIMTVRQVQSSLHTLPLDEFNLVFVFESLLVADPKTLRTIFTTIRHAQRCALTCLPDATASVAHLGEFFEITLEPDVPQASQGSESSRPYENWRAASHAARTLGIKDASEYREKRKRDPRLPTDPSEAYADVWATRSGWNGFLNTAAFRTEQAIRRRERTPRSVIDVHPRGVNMDMPRAFDAGKHK